MCELKLSSNCFPLFSIVELGNLKQLTIGSHSFEWVKELKMANFTQLVTLIFGKGSFGSSLDGSFEMRYCANQIGIFFKNESFMHWNEFIISNCSFKRIKVGVDCFMRCEYAVFNGWLLIESDYE